MFNSYVKLPEGNGKHMGKKHNNPIFLLRSFWDVGFHSWRGNRLNLLIFSGWNQAMSSMPKILTSQPTHHTWSLAAEIIFGKHSHWPLKYWYTGIYIYMGMVQSWIPWKLDGYGKYRKMIEIWGCFDRLGLENMIYIWLHSGFATELNATNTRRWMYFWWFPHFKVNVIPAWHGIFTKCRKADKLQMSNAGLARDASTALWALKNVSNATLELADGGRRGDV